MERILEPELMLELDQAHDYATADFSESHQAFVAEFGARFPRFRRGRMADLGCGPGDVTIRMARNYPDMRFVGLDGSPAMLSFGHQAVAEAGLKDRIRLEERFLPDHLHMEGSFDGTISNSLLHHLPDGNVLWQSMVEMTKVGGPVFVKDLTRPTSREHAEEIVRTRAVGAPPLMARDFYYSLLAAFRPEEVRVQLDNLGLQRFKVEVVSDRHMIIYGRR